jgi:hypothetical protein
LANRVAKSRSLALSFLLSGPPGTGKSAFARHLAEGLDLELVEKRYSDLVSMWLGESEKAIALAFEEAADLRAFLVFDEADSLLRDRAAAQHSWEVTQVNEMLTRMERHPYPFACTTNAPELLDAASARRFLVQAPLCPALALAGRTGLSTRVSLRCAGSHPEAEQPDARRLRRRRPEGCVLRRARSTPHRQVARRGGRGKVKWARHLGPVA